MRFPLRRALRAVWGLLVFSLGVCLTIQADIGLSPWDVLAMGVAGHIPLSYGDVVLAISGVILVVDLLMGEKIGLGTVLDTLIVGKASDFLLSLNLIPRQNTLWGGACLVILGLLVMALGQWAYMSAGLGCGPRDTLLVALGKRLKRLPIGVVSFLICLSVVAAGWALGGPVGLGTVISVLGMGAAMQLVFSLFRFEPRRVVHESLGKTLLGR